jgi:hypothetical protein
MFHKAKENQQYFSVSESDLWTLVRKSAPQTTWMSIRCYPITGFFKLQPRALVREYHKRIRHIPTKIYWSHKFYDPWRTYIAVLGKLKHTYPLEEFAVQTQKKNICVFQLRKLKHKYLHVFMNLWDGTLQKFTALRSIHDAKGIYTIST